MGRAERCGNRKTRESRSKRVPDLGYYIILTDTDETEANYLNGFRNALPEEVKSRIVIKVLKAKTEDLVSACEENAAMVPQYGQPWIVFDRDRVVNFDGIIAEARRKEIGVGWSNPCLEIWFDAYFGTMHSYQDSVTCCSKFSETFERKTGHEYKKDNAQIYEFLARFGDEENAIKIANRRLDQHIRDGYNVPSKMCPCTTMQELIGEIREKTKRKQ